VEQLKTVLAEAGVLSWLKARFPDVSEDDLLAMIDTYFDHIVMDLQKQMAPRG